ncbi:MAG TPA: hypothetical protein DDW55_12980 [Gammaproteobacteria bacterium]|nr:hypothetical protein [Gammaproteobacteria bacterium]
MKTWLIAFALMLLMIKPATAGELLPYDGPVLPDITLPDMHGTIHKLSDYRGKVVLLNFWATWCPPCIKEMPSMQRLEKQLQGQDFTILAVNMGEDENTINAFLKRYPVDFTILLDKDGEILTSWKIVAFPTTFLIDREGRISHALFGGLEWDEPGAVEVVKSLLGGQ